MIKHVEANPTQMLVITLSFDDDRINVNRLRSGSSCCYINRVQRTSKSAAKKPALSTVERAKFDNGKKLLSLICSYDVKIFSLLCFTSFIGFRSFAFPFFRSVRCSFFRSQMLKAENYSTVENSLVQ